MSLHIAKLFIRPLALASAALVVHIGAASAADSTGDIQQQMRELLAGTITTHSAAQSGPPEDKVKTPTVDLQELAKEYLGGITASRAAGAATKRAEVAEASAKTEPQKRPVAYADVQQAMRQVLLGRPYANDPSVTAEAKPQNRPVPHGAAQAALR